jgi:hypothetical protein
MPRLKLRRRRPTIITRADRARDVGEWVLALGLYRNALYRYPGNPPIWIQHGHALKEFRQPGPPRLRIAPRLPTIRKTPTRICNSVLS